MKKWVWVLLAGVILILLAGIFYFFRGKPSSTQLGMTKVEEKEVQALLRVRAELHMKKTRYQVMAATYERILQKSPDDVVTRQGLVETSYQLALLEKELGDLQAAKGRLERILTLDPTHVEAKRLFEELKSSQ